MQALTYEKQHDEGTHAFPKHERSEEVFEEWV